MRLHHQQDRISTHKQFISGLHHLAQNRVIDLLQDLPPACPPRATGPTGSPESNLRQSSLQADLCRTIRNSSGQCQRQRSPLHPVGRDYNGLLLFRKSWLLGNRLRIRPGQQDRFGPFPDGIQGWTTDLHRLCQPIHATPGPLVFGMLSIAPINSRSLSQDPYVSNSANFDYETAKLARSFRWVRAS